MKIISKRQAMVIYRQHPQSRLFRFCTVQGNTSGPVASATMPDGRCRISAVCSPYSLNAARTATARMLSCAALP